MNVDASGLQKICVPNQIIPRNSVSVSRARLMLPLRNLTVPFGYNDSILKRTASSEVSLAGSVEITSR